MISGAVNSCRIASCFPVRSYFCVTSPVTSSRIGHRACTHPALNLDALQALFQHWRTSTALCVDVRLGDRLSWHEYAIRGTRECHAERLNRQRHTPAIVQDAPVAPIRQIAARPIQEVS